MNQIGAFAVMAFTFFPFVLASGQQQPSGKKPGNADLEKLWSILGSDDKEAATRATRELVKGGARSVTYLKQHLKPRVAERPERISQLIKDLDGKDEKARRLASKELENLGDLAMRPLLKVLRDEPEETVLRREVETIIDRIQTARPSAEQLRTIRGIWILAQIRTEGAKTVLEQLAKGAQEARETAEAKAALGSLEIEPD